MTETKEQATMLRSIKDLIGYPIEASDGNIGKCNDFLFDDEQWTLRYLVADTRKWLPGRKVLISPYQFGEPDLGSATKHFRINLTKEGIKASPPLDTDSPVSRRHELEVARFYRYQPYWIGGGVWGGAYSPGVLDAHRPSTEELDRHAEMLRKIEEYHLRSVNEVLGYALSTLEGEIGHVEDFVVETTSWTIRWMIVDTRNWLPGKKVVVSPQWIKGVNWHDRTVSVDLLKDQVEGAPEFDPRTPINRDYERHLFDYYGRPRYW